MHYIQHIILLHSYRIITYPTNNINKVYFDIKSRIYIFNILFLTLNVFAVNVSASFNLPPVRRRRCCRFRCDVFFRSAFQRSENRLRFQQGVIRLNQGFLTSSWKISEMKYYVKSAYNK